MWGLGGFWGGSQDARLLPTGAGEARSPARKPGHLGPILVAGMNSASASSLLPGRGKAGAGRGRAGGAPHPGAVPTPLHPAPGSAPRRPSAPLYLSLSRAVNPAPLPGPGESSRAARWGRGEGGDGAPPNREQPPGRTGAAGTRLRSLPPDRTPGKDPSSAAGCGTPGARTGLVGGGLGAKPPRPPQTPYRSPGAAPRCRFPGLPPTPVAPGDAKPPEMWGGGPGCCPPAPSPGDAKGPGTHLPRAEHRLLELPSRGCSRSRCWGLAPAGPRGGGGPGPSPRHGARPRAGKLRHAAPQSHRAPLSGSQPAAVLRAGTGREI